MMFKSDTGTPTPTPSEEVMFPGLQRFIPFVHGATGKQGIDVFVVNPNNVAGTSIVTVETKGYQSPWHLA